LPVGGEVGLKAGILTRGLQARWFDPRTGRSTAAQPTGDNTFRAPNELDWVLLLRK
jgi:Putative collagen-binding domain of a collagenase